VIAATAAAITAVAGCSSQKPTLVAATPTPVPAGTADPRMQLAARVAAAKDRHFVAGYTLTRPGGKPRAVIVTVALDGTWRVDIQGGALGGSADIAVVGRPDGTYQCALGGGADTGCVKVADRGAKLPAAVDPRIPYVFTSWLNVLTDRQVALSVTAAPALPGIAGACFTVEPVAVSLPSPIDPGVFCYGDDGTFTGAKATFGALALTGQPAAGPATVPLPGAAVSRAALATAAPAPIAPPAGAGTPSGTAKPKATPTKPAATKSASAKAAPPKPAATKSAPPR
jgi:hypothetical protein